MMVVMVMPIKLAPEVMVVVMMMMIVILRQLHVSFGRRSRLLIDRFQRGRRIRNRLQQFRKRIGPQGLARV